MTKSHIWDELTEKEKAEAVELLELFKPENLRFCLYSFSLKDGAIYGKIQGCVFDKTVIELKLFDYAKEDKRD